MVSLAPMSLTRQRSFVIRHSSFVIRHSTLVVLDVHSGNRSEGRTGRPARPGQAARPGVRRCVRVGGASSRSTRRCSSSISTARSRSGANDLPGSPHLQACSPAVSAAASARSSAREELLDAGAHAGDRQLGAVPRRAARSGFRAHAVAIAVGVDRVIAAVDSFGGKVVIRGWTESTAMSRRGRGPRARAVLRRVPLHARRHRRA